MKNKILLTLLLLVSLPLSVCAKTNYQAGTNITIDEDYKSSIMLAGQDIEVKEDIDIYGISIMAGSNINFEGTTEHLVAASDTIKIRGKVSKDAFVVGNKLSSYGELDRDLYAAANSIYLSNKIDGNIKLFGSTIKLEDITITKNITIYSTNIEFGDNVIINGKLKYNDNAIVKGLDNIDAKNVETFESDIMEVSFQTRLMDILSSLLNSLFIGFILLYFIPKLFINEKPDTKYMGIGALAILLTPFAILISLITPFAMVFGICLLGAYMFAIYIANIFTAFFIGNYVNTLLLHNNDSKYVSLIVGIVTLKLLTIMPIIGSLVAIISVLYGTGYMITKIKK